MGRILSDAEMAAFEATPEVPVQAAGPRILTDEEMAAHEMVPTNVAPQLHSSGPPQDLIDRLANYLPAAGGLIGGIAGLPADLPTLGGSSIAGAGAGAAGGAALKNLIHEYRHPEQPKTSAFDDIYEGAKSAAGQAVGEKVIAPVLSAVGTTGIGAALGGYEGYKHGGVKGAALGALGGGYVGSKVPAATEFAADKLKDLANWATNKSTGVTGNQVYRTFPEGAPELLRKLGIVGAGDTQKAIAAKADAALEASGKDISAALEGLDAQGASVSKADIVAEIRRRATEIGQKPSGFSVSDALHKIAERMEGGAEDAAEVGGELATDIAPGAASTVPDNIPLKSAELIKREFQDGVNYATPKDQHILADEMADIYRKAVENKAEAIDPDMAAKFKDAKELYGALNPISEATGKRAAVIAQKQGPNFHSLGTTGMGAVLGGEEGYKHGGIAGAVTGGLIGGAIGARAPSTIAAGSDVLSKFLTSPTRLFSAMGAAGQAVTRMGADRISDVVRDNPQALGKWAPRLKEAADRSDTALNASHFVLMQTDPAYRDHIKKTLGDEQ